MQGVVCLPQNLQQGSSPPPNSTIVADMEMDSKDANLNQSDSGIFSATNTTMDSHHHTEDDNRSDCSTPERKYVCPICEKMLTSQHDFTLHIRSHNNESAELQDTNEKGFVCRICNKVLSSSSSLDRHVLVHSGERPFHCKYCGDTFTTNGNMHRHMRTHKNDHNYESDGSVESNASAHSKTEYNNNKIESKTNLKRKLEMQNNDGVESKRRDVHQNGDNRQTFKCPVCDRTDFDSMTNLETHLEDNHPEYPSKCGQCKQIFPNNKLLSIHKTSHDHGATKHPVVGFKDLTFVDFSSEKFPHIARRECEMNLHKVAGGLKFQCKRCARAFPCTNSLEIHEKNCVTVLEMGSGLDLSKTNDSEIRRLEFFSRLNLQDNSPEKKSFPTLENPTKLREQLAKAICMDSNKDLADIQSILTNINLQQQKHGGLSGGGKSFDTDTMKNNEQQEEESQDLFAVEFRKMKLRGEFPCRLCTAVFPNLRALKGHNRAHLSGNNNGTYHCNMCPHSSIDKAALIRHMRTHNGDRPYECSLCNYAFTTKANCERHLRNRHAKSTREEVKKAIIYHPSEDPTNEDLNKLTARETDGKKLNVSVPDVGEGSPEKLHCSTPKLDRSDIKSELFKPNLPPLIPDLHKLKPQFFNDILRGNKLPEPMPYFPPKLPPSPSKIQVKSLETLKSYEQSDDEFVDEEEEEPMVLDLSKKKKEERKRLDSEDGPQDLTKKSPPLPAPFMGDLFAQQLLKTPPKIDPTALYASQLARFYQNSFPNWAGFPINPLLFPAMAPMATNPQELKERMQRLQLCGGSFIAEDLKHIQTLQQQSMRYNGFKMDTKLDERKSDDLKPLTVETAFHHESISKLQSPSSKDLMQSPNSVKMVIKNGVLMPKQKQRRYRTERPFTCEHCSARFTLRSNMERHIKQQHPQFWSQRQRGSVGNPGRKSHTTMKPGYCDLSIPNYEVPKTSDYEDSKEHLNEKLKFAILAQQLRAAVNQPDIKKEEIDDDALVIDEKKTDEKHHHQRPYEGSKILEEKLNEYQHVNREKKNEESQDLVPVARLLDNASQQQFKEYFKRDGEEQEVGGSEEDEEGLVASGSTSEGNVSGTDENKSESETIVPVKKKSAYSLAPNRVSCPYCSRKFPWTSSLRRHILTHTGQKPFKCSHCPLLFTTKSNCDRHLLRKHGNSATTITNDQQNNNANFLIRNVPERPFKCSNCPSSTFSTYSNLKKHISCKHATNAQGDDIKAQGYEAGSSEDEKVTGVEKSDWDQPAAVYSAKLADNNSAVMQTCDLPFKCHLCDGSFGDRQEALEHIRDKHASEYDLLMSKNALDSNATTPDDSGGGHHDDEESEIRGKFPDYSNRKVICAFCMRRFWSAEDLRRHMRTHTGERPFSCDICRRRFTLKHSMLRHRKKHNFENDNVSDEDGNQGGPFEKYVKGENNNVQKQEKTDESDGNEGGDLISNLLGIRDRSIIDKVLAASADDAAKLLGVKNGVKE